MTRLTKDRFVGSEPDEFAAIALAARALRHLARFHRSARAGRRHDTHGLLEWAAVPAAAEINASYRKLLDQAAGGEAESDAAYWAYLLLVEDILFDAACDRPPVSSGELAAAAQMIRIMREEAEFALECAGRPSAAAAGHERPAEPARSDPAAGDGAGVRAKPTLLAMLARRDEIDLQFSRPRSEVNDDARERLVDEQTALESLIAATPPRGDADLIAKARYAALQVAENNGGRPLGDVDRLVAVLLADVVRIVGGDKC